MQRLNAMVAPNGRVYDIPDDEVEAFRADFPGAKEARNLRADGRDYTVPADEVAAFRADFPRAESTHNLRLSDGSARRMTVREMNDYFRSPDYLAAKAREDADFNARLRADRADYEARRDAPNVGDRVKRGLDFAASVGRAWLDNLAFREGSAWGDWMRSGESLPADMVRNVNAFAGRAVKAVAEIPADVADLAGAGLAAVGAGSAAARLKGQSRAYREGLERNIATDAPHLEPGLAGANDFAQNTLVTVGRLANPAAASASVAAGTVRAVDDTFEQAVANGVDVEKASALANGMGILEAVKGVVLANSAGNRLVNTPVMKRIMSTLAGKALGTAAKSVVTGAEMGVAGAAQDVVRQGAEGAAAPDWTRTGRVALDEFLHGSAFDLVAAGVHAVDALAFHSEPKGPNAALLREAVATAEGRAALNAASPDAARDIIRARREGKDVSRALVRRYLGTDAATPERADRNALGDALAEDYRAVREAVRKRPDPQQAAALAEDVQGYVGGDEAQNARIVRRVLEKVADARELDDPQARQRLVQEAADELLGARDDPAIPRTANGTRADIERRTEQRVGDRMFAEEKAWVEEGEARREAEARARREAEARARAIEEADDFAEQNGYRRKDPLTPKGQKPGGVEDYLAHLPDPDAAPLLAWMKRNKTKLFARERKSSASADAADSLEKKAQLLFTGRGGEALDVVADQFGMTPDQLVDAANREYEAYVKWRDGKTRFTESEAMAREREAAREEAQRRDETAAIVNEGRARMRAEEQAAEDAARAEAEQASAEAADRLEAGADAAARGDSRREAEARARMEAEDEAREAFTRDQRAKAARLAEADEAAESEKPDRKDAPALALERATSAELAAEERRRADRAKIKARQDAPLKGGAGETGQSLLDLGGAEGEDLFNRTRRTGDAPQHPPLRDGGKNGKMTAVDQKRLTAVMRGLGSGELKHPRFTKEEAAASNGEQHERLWHYILSLESPDVDAGGGAGGASRAGGTPQKGGGKLGRLGRVATRYESDPRDVIPAKAKYLDRGAESTVYQDERSHVLKVRRLQAFDMDDVKHALARIVYHNYLFPKDAYTLQDIAVWNNKGRDEFYLVLEQPLVTPKTDKAGHIVAPSMEQIAEALRKSPQRFTLWDEAATREGLDTGDATPPDDVVESGRRIAYNGQFMVYDFKPGRNTFLDAATGEVRFIDPRVDVNDPGAGFAVSKFGERRIDKAPFELPSPAPSGDGAGAGAGASAGAGAAGADAPLVPGATLAGARLVPGAGEAGNAPSTQHQAPSTKTGTSPAELRTAAREAMRRLGDLGGADVPALERAYKTARGERRRLIGDLLAYKRSLGEMPDAKDAESRNGRRFVGNSNDGEFLGAPAKGSVAESVLEAGASASAGAKKLAPAPATSTRISLSSAVAQGYEVEAGGASAGASASAGAGKLAPAPATSTNSPVARQQIVDAFRRLYGDSAAFRSPGTQGVAKWARGHFEPRAGNIRVKKGEDPLGVIPHEVGHHIDYRLKRAGLARPPAVRNDLVGLGRALYGARRPNGGYEAEGFAELVKNYIQGNDAALERHAPAALDWLTRRFATRFPDEMARLDALRDLTARFRAQSAEQAVYGLMAPAPGLGRRVARRIADAAAGFTQEEWIDQGAFLSKGLRAAGLDKVMDWQAALKRGDAAEANAIIENHPVLKWKLYNGKAAARAFNGLKDGLADLSGTRRYTYGDLGMPVDGHLPSEPLPSFRDVFGDFRPDEMRRFQAYALARVAKENYHARGMAFGISPREADAALRTLESPKFRNALDRYTHYKHGVLHLLVDAGAMSQAQFEEIVRANPVYVKVSRRMDDGGASLFRRMLRGPSRAVNARTGSERQVEDVFDAGLVDDERVIRAAFQADLVKSIVATGRRGEAAGGVQAGISTGANWLREVPNAKGRVVFSAAKVRKQIADAMVNAGKAADAKEAGTFFDALFGAGDTLSVFREKPSNGKGGLVSIYDADGVMHTYELPQNNGEAWAKGLFGFTDASRPGALETVGAFATAGVRAGATMLNPAFALRNVVRDTLHSSVMSEFGASIPGLSSAEGLVHNLLNTSPKKIYESMGLEMGGMMGESKMAKAHRANKYLMSPNWFAAQWNKGVVKAVADFVGVSENATRLREFRAARDYMLRHGASEKAAAMVAGCNALDVTVDFQRGGHKARRINRAIPFFNANVQGIEQFGRALGLLRAKEWQLGQSRGRRAARTVAKGLASLTVPALLAYLYNNADEERRRRYAELPPHEKWNYTSFGDLRLPVPFETGYAFSSLPVAVLEEMNGRRGSVAECLDMMRRSVPSLAPRDIAALSAVIDVVSNEDWKGSPIVSESTMRSKEAWEWYNPNTTEFSRRLGKALYDALPDGDFRRSCRLCSPAHLDVVFNDVSGGLIPRLARTATDGFGVDSSRPSTWPVVGTFFRSPTNSRVAGDFYARRDGLRRGYGSRSVSLEDYGRLLAMDEVAERAAPLWEDSRNAQADRSLSNRERNDRIEANTRRVQQMMRETEADPSALREKGLRRAVAALVMVGASEEARARAVLEGVGYDEARRALVAYGREVVGEGSKRRRRWGEEGVKSRAARLRRLLPPD